MIKKLKQEEGLKLTGKWKLTARHIRTGEVIVKEGENLIVNVGKYLVGDMLIDRAGYDTGLTYQAISENAAAPVPADTNLITEAGRKAITAKSRLLNVITYSTFFTAGESTFNIKKAGIFGHNATGAPGDGILCSAWLVSFDNTGGLFDLTFDLIWTIG